ncbi:hypothetical protein [Trueperella sp. LYQ143]|uniref:hypothetical protein n=1 Tax=unclassified Trueperella TaxID=2630174 RepID=UPI003982EDF4
MVRFSLARKQLLVGIAAVGVLLSGCGGSDESPAATPTIVDSPAVSVQQGTATASNGNKTYTNAPDVIVGEDGQRSFPTITTQETLDLMWEQALSDIPEGTPIPERPQVDVVVVKDPEQNKSGYVQCMADSGFPGFTISDSGVSSPEIPAGQIAAYNVADYICTAKNFVPTPAPMDEADMNRLYDHQINYVIPCLEKLGYRVHNFPSRQTFVDRYFAERQYELATDLVGLSPQESAKWATEDESVSCHAYPPGLWDE